MSPPSDLASSRMDEVATLTTSLSDAVLYARMVGHGVSDEQVYALAKAARLFHDRGEPWPPILEQVLHELTDEVADGDSVESEPDHAVADTPAIEDDQPGEDRGMMRFFNGLKRTKD